MVWRDPAKAQVYFQTRTRTLQRRRRAEGRCLVCGLRLDEPADRNPRTGRPFARCSEHRLTACLANRRYQQARAKRERNAG